MITIHEVARADLSMSTPVYTLLTIGWSYIVNLFGTEQLQQEVLPQIGGRQVLRRHQHHRARWRFRPGRHQDHRGPVECADNYVMNGEKAYVSGPKECVKLGAPSRSLLPGQVTAPTTGHKGMTFI